MNKYKLLKEIEPGESLPIGSILDIEGKYCTLDNNKTIPIERLITHGYLEMVIKDKFDVCIEDIWYGERYSKNSLKNILKKHFPTTDTSRVIDMKDYLAWCESKGTSILECSYDDYNTLLEYLQEKGFTFIKGDNYEN